MFEAVCEEAKISSYYVLKSKQPLSLRKSL